MTYKELCKVSFKKSIQEVFLPRRSRRVLRNIISYIFNGLKDLLLFTLSYLFSLTYLLTFPISSVIVYLSHRKQSITIKRSKQDEIKKRFPNIKQPKEYYSEDF